MAKKRKSDAGKDISWPGATPYLALVSRQNPFGLRRSHPATKNWLRRRLFCFSRVCLKPVVANLAGNFCQSSLARSATTLWQFLPQIQQPGKETSMPLLKPPKPPISKRKYYIRLDEPLALTMECYAEFIGANSADHVITQALELVFKKDSDFRDWLEKNPTQTSASPLRKATAIQRRESGRVPGKAEREEAV